MSEEAVVVFENWDGEDEEDEWDVESSCVNCGCLALGGECTICGAVLCFSCFEMGGGVCDLHGGG